jgi:hypothetical protein
MDAIFVVKRVLFWVPPSRARFTNPFNYTNYENLFFSPNFTWTSISSCICKKNGLLFCLSFFLITVEFQLIFPYCGEFCQNSKTKQKKLYIFFHYFSVERKLFQKIYIFLFFTWWHYFFSQSWKLRYFKRLASGKFWLSKKKLCWFFEKKKDNFLKQCFFWEKYDWKNIVSLFLNTKNIFPFFLFAPEVVILNIFYENRKVFTNKITKIFFTFDGKRGAIDWNFTNIDSPSKHDPLYIIVVTHYCFW